MPIAEGHECKNTIIFAYDDLNQLLNGLTIN